MADNRADMDFWKSTTSFAERCDVDLSDASGFEGLSHSEKTERRKAKIQGVAIELLEELLDFSRVLGAGAV